jgi:hypothetical protein
VMPWFQTDGYRCFRRTCCLHLQSRRACDEDGTSKFYWTSVMIYQTVWCHNPEENICIVSTMRTWNLLSLWDVQNVVCSSYTHLKHSDRIYLGSFSLYNLCP